MRPFDLVADVLDLVLGRACRHCEEPGRVLCDGCLAALRGRVSRIPHPAVGLASVTLPYDDGGPLVLAYKERATLSLAPMLGVLLADAVSDQMALLGVRTAVLLPVPSHPRPARGFDALAGLVRPALRELRSRGLRVAVADPVLVARHRRPLKGLGREERLREAGDAFVMRGCRGPVAQGPLIVVDDVLTTGATTTAVVDELRRHGRGADGIATVTGVIRDRPAPTLARAPTTRR